MPMWRAQPDCCILVASRQSARQIWLRARLRNSGLRGKPQKRSKVVPNVEIWNEDPDRGSGL